MEVGGWFHDLATLPPGRELPPPRTYWMEGSVGLRSKCGHNGEYQPLACWFTDMVIAVSSI